MVLLAQQVVRFCRRCAVDLGLPSSNLQGHFYLPAKDTVQMCSSIPLLPQVDMYHVFLYGLEKACFSHGMSYLPTLSQQDVTHTF
ncbi:Os08g0234400 [Oryza sativa Japonica Group]|uniref:Os08g0234400 protein n=1 Tax=Oryza sativa subsp. japonica TaxID=39947 RepID=C7J6E3_ORYSJ|nr:Os08g0234400 [Oryza sativa Japonica Group]|eukprot:NP_001175451.1 Os08g0234400 [Oryza sativa Japonica Group]